MPFAAKDHWRWAVWGLRHVTTMLDELRASELVPGQDSLDYLREHRKILDKLLAEYEAPREIPAQAEGP